MAAPARAGWAVAPRYATPRTPSRRRHARGIGLVASAMQRPLQPWQGQVVDVASELLPNGDLAFPVVVVHVQRQAGKTSLLGPVNVHTCLTCQGAKTWLTAQTRQDGRDTWRDVAELVARSPVLGPQLVMRRSNGSEELSSPATGSSFRVFAPTEDALHGKANRAVSVDEVWAFDGAQGQALEQAILPTFATTGGQLWLVSTAGTAASTWLRGYVDRGRALAAAGDTTSGLAYFEWSLAPAAAAECTDRLHQVHALLSGGQEIPPDLLDPAVQLLLDAHPGQYVRGSSVRQAALSMAPGQLLRAYGNVWTLTADRLVPDHLWADALDKQLAPPEPATSPALAFDVTLDRHGAVGASWTAPDGRQAVDVADARPGTEWMPERLEQLAARLGLREVACDGQGPALDVADTLERRGVVRVRRLSTVEYLTACAGFLASVEQHRLVHRGTPALNEAVAAAGRREVGDRWAWSRRTSAGPIAGLVAATVASYAQTHAPAELPCPQLVSLAERRPAPEPAAARVRRSIIL